MVGGGGAAIEKPSSSAAPVNIQRLDREGGGV